MGSRFSSATTTQSGVEVRRVWTWPDDLKLLAALQKAGVAALQKSGGLESPTLAAMKQLGFDHADTADRVKVLWVNGVLLLLEWLYGPVFGCWSGVLPIPSDNAFPTRRDFEIVIHNRNGVGAKLSMAHYDQLLDFYEMTIPADDRSHPTPLTSSAFARCAANTLEAEPVQYETVQLTQPPSRMPLVTGANETQPLVRMVATGDGRARETATETKAGDRATSISSTLACVVAGGRESDTLANTNTNNAPSATTSTPHAMWTLEQPAIHDNGNTPANAKTDGTRRCRHASSGTEDASEPQEKRRARSSDKEDAEEDDAQAE